MLTRGTADEVIREALSGVTEALVVGGHTHQQFIRPLGDGRMYANAGSVGMPWEGRPGAFWLEVIDGTPTLRATSYDFDQAAAELRATGFPDIEETLNECLLNPVDPNWVTEFFEHHAGRGPDPGPQR